MLLERRAERVADVGAPQVLVLDVDHPPRTGQGLGVAPRDAALAADGEGVVAAEEQVGIGAQQLDGVGAVGDLRRRRGLLGQRVRREVHAEQTVLEPAEGVAVERGRVLPPLAEDRLDVVHGRSGDGGHDVVPRRGVAVLRRHRRQRLRVAVVGGVVATGVAQVDAADVGDVAGGVVAVTDHHHLLVVRAAQTHPHVEQRLGTAVLEVLAQTAVGVGREAEPGGVRAPHEPAYVDSTLVGAGEHLGDLGAGLPGESLVAVALPVGEEHQVARDGGLEPFVELGEVRRPVHQRPHPVATAPRAVARVPVVEPCERVAPLGLRQQPRGRVGQDAALGVMGRG